MATRFWEPVLSNLEIAQVLGENMLNGQLITLVAGAALLVAEFCSPCDGRGVKVFFGTLLAILGTLNVVVTWGLDTHSFYQTVSFGTKMASQVVGTFSAAVFGGLGVTYMYDGLKR